MKCPMCQTENTETAKFCMKCGSRLGEAAPSPMSQEGSVCPKCGLALRPGVKFCVGCGTLVVKQDQTNTAIAGADTGSAAWMPPPPVVVSQDDIVPQRENPASIEEKSITGMTIVAVMLGVVAIVGIVVAIGKYRALDDIAKEAAVYTGDMAEPENQSEETTASDSPMQDMLVNRQYTELVNSLLEIDDMEFYGDEDNMREYMRQALVGHMNAAIDEANSMASEGNFDGAYAKLDEELAYRDGLKGQGRVYPFTEDSVELDMAKEQMNSRFTDYITQSVQDKADQRDLEGMEAVLGQASGHLQEDQYNRIYIEAYKLYVIKMVEQMQADGRSHYDIMDFIDSYFEKTNYHGYLMELWDNQNAQSGRVGAWNTIVTHDGNGYLLSNSDSRAVSESELGNFSQYELYLARWEIYARHNRIFVDSAVNAYFSKYNWYHGDADFNTFDDSSLNDIEKGNIKTIIDYEKKCGYR